MPGVLPAQPFPPPWIPERPPEKWTLTEVVKHVKTAMMIELTTIPLYLYAAYSIDVTSPDLSSSALADGKDARSKILGIVIQEMLHLALSGNLLCALDGVTELYDFRIIPQFPGSILYEKVELDLNRADRDNITLFKEVEQPVDTVNIRHKFSLAREELGGLLPEYRSIGEFYEMLKQGLASLSEDHFKNFPEYQFTPTEFPHMKGMAVINGLTIAQNSLELIVEQGEGGPEVEGSHYKTFAELSSGPPTWNLFDVKTNPKTKDFRGLGTPQNFAYKLSLAFDAGYCYLLQNIQRVWGRGGNSQTLHTHLVGNMLTIMKSIMPSLADILVHQPLYTYGSGSPAHSVAAPCFNYYPIKDDGEPDTPLEPEDLLADFVKLLVEAASIAATNPLTQKYATQLTSLAEAAKKLTPRP